MFCHPGFLPATDGTGSVSRPGARQAFCRVEDYPKPGIVLLRDAAGRQTVVAQPPGSARLFEAGMVIVDRTKQREDRELDRHNQTVIEAYSLLQLDPPETSLSPRERVQAILERTILLNWEGAKAANRIPLQELRAVPGFEREVLAIVGDPGSRYWTDAVAAAAWLQLPGAAQVMLRLYDQPMPPDPREPAGEEETGENHAEWDAFHRARDKFVAAQTRRGWLVLALAHFDDETAAARLGPLLLSPKLTGPFRLNDREMHAALYRMLARVGGDEPARVLAAFDQSGGPSSVSAKCPSEASRVVAEAVRCLRTFKLGPDPMMVESAPADWCPSAPIAGQVTWRRPTRVRANVAQEAVVVASVAVAGETAQVNFGSPGPFHLDLSSVKLRRVAGNWRVVEQTDSWERWADEPKK
jgi:hypothetical protein